MQAAGGETLQKIVVRKESERKTGNGVFWWGLGTPLGETVETAAASNGGELPALFSEILGRPQTKDASPERVCVWNGWQSISRLRRGNLPNHVLVTGGADPSGRYYALVGRSSDRIVLGNHGYFEPTQSQTFKNGKVPGSSQTAAVLTDRHGGIHSRGRYIVSFVCRLVDPWYVKLTQGRVLTGAELDRLRRYEEGDDWMRLVRSLRKLPPS